MDFVINKTFIKENKLISKIEYDGKEYDMFFAVEKEYLKYLCDDNANAFLIALLPFIVKHNYNVVVKDRISSKLYYQLTTYLLPLLCTNFNKKEINIKCELTDKTYNGSAVAASISCGVDSFYTLLKHKNLKDSKKNITHLCFFNAGSNGQYGGDSARSLYNERINHIKDFCKEYDYSFVTVDSNMNELILMNHEKRHTFTTLSCVFALEKLFNTYYFASGLGFNGSHIDESDTAFYDILNVHCLSNENISFYCSGLETTRIEKVKYISNFEETYNWLNVCVRDEWDNCCKCRKCMRTMTELESIGKLEKYKNVFDLKYYYKNKNMILSEIIAGQRDLIQKEFCNEIISSYRKNNIKIPIQAYFLSHIPTKKKIKNSIKKLLPKKIVEKTKNKKLNKKHDGWMD